MKKERLRHFNHFDAQCWKMNVSPVNAWHAKHINLPLVPNLRIETIPSNDPTPSVFDDVSPYHSTVFELSQIVN